VGPPLDGWRELFGHGISLSSPIPVTLRQRGMWGVATSRPAKVLPPDDEGLVVPIYASSGAGREIEHSCVGRPIKSVYSWD
jgi:hypothetical protein